MLGLNIRMINQNMLGFFFVVVVMETYSKKWKMELENLVNVSDDALNNQLQSGQRSDGMDITVEWTNIEESGQRPLESELGMIHSMDRNEYLLSSLDMQKVIRISAIK